jgi:hypothetical protein
MACSNGSIMKTLAVAALVLLVLAGHATAAPLRMLQQSSARAPAGAVSAGGFPAAFASAEATSHNQRSLLRDYEEEEGCNFSCPRWVHTHIVWGVLLQVYTFTANNPLHISPHLLALLAIVCTRSQHESLCKQRMVQPWAGPAACPTSPGLGLPYSPHIPNWP